MSDFIIIKNFYGQEHAIKRFSIQSVRKHLTQNNRLGVVVKYTNNTDSYISCKNKKHQTTVFKALVG